MKFKVGEMWRTRDGSKAECLAIRCGKIVWWSWEATWVDSPVYMTYEDGRFWGDNCDSKNDIIEPWREKFDQEMWVHVNPRGGIIGDTTHSAAESCAAHIASGWRCIKVRVVEVDE